MYVMPEWFVTSPSSPVSRIRCFMTDFMEPYLMVRLSPDLPLFDDRFVNYGYNKVEYVENLRQAGFSFFILNQAFAMDFPHPEWEWVMLLKSSTEFRTAYHNMIHSNSGNPMKDVYNDLQKKFNRDFQYRESFPVCFLRQLAYYEELLCVCWRELRYLVVLILNMRSLCRRVEM